jgi:hypothetical protein
MKKNFYIAIIFLLIGLFGGVIVGVVVDVDQKVEIVVKRFKQKNSPGGSMVVEIENPEMKSKKELRQEKKETRKGKRDQRKENRKSK